MNKKGISNLTGAIMLIAIVVSISILVMNFIPNLMHILTDGTSNKASRTLDSGNYRLEIDQAEHDLIEDRVTANVLNRGSPIKGNVTVSVFCNQNLYQQRLSNIKKAGIEPVTFDNIECKATELEAVMEDYPASDRTNEIRYISENLWTIGNAADFLSNLKSSTNILFSPLELEKKSYSTSENTTFTGSKTNLTAQGGSLKLETN